MFSKPVVQQAVAMTNILDSAKRKFFPRKTLVINPRDQPWVNSYTHLLMQKKKYCIKKKNNSQYFSAINRHGVYEELVTCLNKKNNKKLCFKKCKGGFQSNY